MSLVEHARRELELCGQYEEDPDFSESLIDAVRAFSAYGHSGSSAAVATHMLHDLLQYKTLSPLTDDPDEWNHIEEDKAGDAITWQNRRRPDAFSQDGGKTYYCLDDPDNFRPGTAEDADPYCPDEIPLMVSKSRDEWVMHTSQPHA